MTGHRVLQDLLVAQDVFVGNDPGDAGDIWLDRDRMLLLLQSSAAETRTLKDPPHAGVMLLMAMETDGGDITITADTAYDQNGETEFVFKDTGDFIALVAVNNGSGAVWRVLAWDGVTGPSPQLDRLFGIGGGVNNETLGGNKTLTVEDAIFQRLDPSSGTGRDVTLPAEGDSIGKAFRILNTADAAESLTVKDDGGSTIVTIAQNEAAWVICDGTNWRHMGIETIALS